MISYVSYEDVVADLGITEPDDDEILRERVEQASHLLNTWCDRIFYPNYATRYYSMPPTAHLLMLEEDLLELDTLTTDNGGTEIPAASYFPARGRDYSKTPYTRIYLDKSSVYRFTYTGTPHRSQAVTGFWGYHERYGDALEDSGDAVADSGGIDASATTITVADADGPTRYGLATRFKPQQLLRVDDELILVRRVNFSSDELTVTRGMCGTTAAAHDESATITIYRPMAPVVRATLRLAEWLYKQKDTQVFDTTAFVELGVVEVPAGLPRDVGQLIKRLKRKEL